jgi:hypothetical protein
VLGPPAAGSEAVLPIASSSPPVMDGMRWRWKFQGSLDSKVHVAGGIPESFHGFAQSRAMAKAQRLPPQQIKRPCVLKC